jgi:CAAX protease family protein
MSNGGKVVRWNQPDGTAWKEWKDIGMKAKALTTQQKEIRFFLLSTFIWTWLFWIGLSTLTKLGITSIGKALFVTMHLVGGFGPTIMAVICVARRPGEKTVRHFLNTWLPNRITSQGLLVFFVVAVYVASKPITLWLTGHGANLLVDNWPSMLILFPNMILGGGLEEPGWRGVVYDDSNSLKGGKPWALLSMALVWILWHVPLWFIPGTDQNLHMDFISFALSMSTLTLLFYAIRISGASVGWVILAHAFYNTLVGVFAPSIDITADRIITLAQLLVVITLFWGFLQIQKRRTIESSTGS